MRFTRALLALAATLSLVAGIAPEAWGTHVATVSSRDILLTEPNQHITDVNSSGKWLLVRDPYWHAARKVYVYHHKGGQFTVRRSVVNDGSGHVAGYPDVLRGCIWQVCTASSHLPKRVGSIRSLRMTWHTRQRATGVWNAATDIWFGKHRHARDGSATRNGAELMIWLNKRHMGRHGDTGPIFKIAGIRWHFWLWRTCDRSGNTSACWNYIAFHAVHPRWRVNNLDIKAFIRFCEHHHHIIKPWWYLQSVGAGFEIVKGGRGLATTKFNTTVR